MGTFLTRMDSCGRSHGILSFPIAEDGSIRIPIAPAIIAGRCICGDRLFAVGMSFPGVAGHFSTAVSHQVVWRRRQSTFGLALRKKLASPT
jgi:hypothetical protein